ncbi:MAG TPA: putative Ig domain-containing protein [Planctomycetota bacterium]|nr:putative Ig domain-containing protein [Planctomycetota bacterium]
MAWIVAAAILSRGALALDAAPRGSPPPANTITIANFSFSPSTLTVNAGDTVTWTNNDALPHTVTSDLPPADPNYFDLGSIAANSSKTHFFASGNTYMYHSADIATHGKVIVNQAAHINGPFTANLKVNDPFAYSLTATGYPVPALSFGTLPTGITSNGNAATLSGSFALPGTYPINLQASNTPGTDNEQLIVTVTGVAPVITSPLTAVAIVGQPFSYTLSATGLEAPTLTFSNLPPELTADNTSATISGTFTSAETVTVGLSATNTTGADNQTLTITVAIPPHITSPLTATAIAGIPWSYTLAASGDPAPDLTFSEIQTYFQINGPTLSGTYDGPAIVRTTLHATNVGGTDTQVLIVTVAGVAPAINSPLNANAALNVPFSYTATASGLPSPIISFSNLPPELSANGPTISGTFANPGPVTLHIHAANGQTPDDNETLTINVQPTAPSITSPLTAATNIGDLFRYTLTAAGGPPPTVSFVANTIPPGFQISPDGTTIIGRFGSAGTVNIGLHATNGVSPDADQTLVVTVSNIPAAITSPLTANAVADSQTVFSYTLTASGVPAPQLSIDGQLPTGFSVSTDGSTLTGTFTSAGTYQFGVHATNPGHTDDETLVVIATASAPNTAPQITSVLTANSKVNDPFVYSLTATGNPVPALSYGIMLPAGITSHVTSNGNAAALGGSFRAPGQFAIDLYATNTVATDHRQLVVTVAGVAPVITSPRIVNTAVGQQFSYTVTATGIPAPTFQIFSPPPLLTQNGATLSGSLSYPGPAQIRIFADNAYGRDDQTITINVAGSASRITSSLTAQANVGTPFSYTLTASGIPVPGVSFTNVPAGFQLSPDGATINGTFSATGPVSIGLQATNGQGDDDQTLVVNVDPPLAAPQISSALTASVVAGQRFQYTLAATGVPNPALSFTNIPSGFQLLGSTLSGTFQSPGQFSIGLHATNSQGNDDEMLVVTVAGVAPQITSALTANATLNTLFVYSLVATGIPNPHLSFTNVPSALHDLGGGTLVGSFTTGGTYSVGIHASNSAGADDKTLTITVAGIAPKITSSLSASAVVGTPFTYTLAATGNPNPTLAFVNVPDILQINGATISGTFTGAGQIFVGLLATNSAGADSQTLTITVSNIPAKITSSLTASAIAGADFLYAVTASGAAPINFSASGMPSGISFVGSTLVGAFTDAGTYTIALTASNSGGSDTQNLVVTVMPNTEGVSGQWSGTIKGKSFDLTGAGAISAKDNRPISVIFFQRGRVLTTRVTLSGTGTAKSYLLSGKVGANNLWSSGFDAVGVEAMTLSAQLAANGKSIKGIGILYSKTGTEEMTFTLTKK